MIQVEFSIPTDTEWRDWVRRGRSARAPLLKAARPGKLIDENLYKEQRQRFLKAFHQKCAYCELKIVPGQRLGEVEHYRPKGRVMNEAGKLVFSSDRRHPGYYWLAYKWRNLLPACLACNRPGTDPQGYRSGKWDRFPVADGFWATSPRELRRERPLILNPWFDDPNEHLTFDIDTGIIGHKTDRGEITWKILGLNRDGLPEARRRTCEYAAMAHRLLHEAMVREHDVDIKKHKAEILAHLSGAAEFAAFGRAALIEAQRRYDEQVEKVRKELGL